MGKRMFDGEVSLRLEFSCQGAGTWDWKLESVVAQFVEGA